MLTAKFDSKGNLVVTIPADKKAKALSASGKTRRVASSQGNKATELMVDGQAVVIGLNAYIYAQPK
jgi:hypothetical protein